MELSGVYKVPASQQDVWNALNTADILRKCIPGCEEIEQHSPTSFSAIVTAKVGPVKAKFKGNVDLKDLVPPQSYRIEGQGNGGAAGFAKGGANVTLEECQGATDLSYIVNAQVGGKLAQIGQRFIDATAKKLADEFFQNLGEHFAGTPEASEGAQVSGQDIIATEATEGVPPLLWGAALIIGALLLLGFLSTL